MYRCWNKEDLKRWKDAFLIHLPWLIDEGPPTEFHVGDIHVNSDNCENLDYSCLTLNWTKNWTQEMWEGIFTEALLLKGNIMLRIFTL